MSYWDKTDEILRRSGGKGPICSVCKTEMYPIDDHGRFGCKCNPFGPVLRSFRIPQVPEGTELTDEQKNKIPPINRLNLPPTEEEKKFFKDAFNQLRKDP